MKKKGIYIFLFVLMVVIVVVIVNDFATNKPGKRPSNPFEYEMDSFHATPEDEILYKETRNLKMKIEQLTGIACLGEELFVTGDRNLQVIGLDGTMKKEVNLPEEPLCVAVSGDRIYAGGLATVMVLDLEGNLVSQWKDFAETSLITSIAVYEDNIFLADAGRRRVYRYLPDGTRAAEFEGKSTDDVLHGFIVPSACFDVGVNEFGDLWVANPGKHALENYTFDGNLRGFWTSVFSDVKGFQGCCNPAHFAFLPGGNFITCEKGVIRVKEYKPSGEYVGVVAAPAKFIEEGKVPDITADGQGRVYVCDPDKKSIRIFEKI